MAWVIYRWTDRMVVYVNTVDHLLYGMSIVAVLLQECRSVEQQSAVTKVVSYSYHTHVTFPMFSMASHTCIVVFFLLAQIYTTT